MDKPARYYITGNVTIDLEEVIAVSVEGRNQFGYFYQVVFKNGAILKVEGTNLNTQFKEHKGVEVNEQV